MKIKTTKMLYPGKPALIYGSMKKTDKEDSLKLARMICRTVCSFTRG